MPSEDWKREEDDEDDEIDENEYKAVKDAILFAIEVSPSMLEPPPPSDAKKADTDSPVSAAIKCAYQLMQQRIISNPNDMMGVLLFGTAQSKFLEDEDGRSDAPFPHCYLLTDLEVPSASDAKALKEIIEDDEEAKSLLAASKDEVSMTNVLFGANQIFTRKAPNFASRRLFIITDRDDPHTNDKAMRSAAATRAKDLYDLGIIIELFPISRVERDFDRTKFYDDIIYRDPTNPDAPADVPSKFVTGADGMSLLHALIADVNSKQTPKRALFSNLPLEIGPGFKISVNGYNVISKQKPAPSCYVYMDGPVPQLVKAETTHLEADSAMSVEKAELRKGYKFGGSHVMFTAEEQKELKNFGPPGITIIGFKPTSMVPIWASVHKSTFIYPSEGDYVGSTRVFSALWSKLLKDNKVALAWYIARANARPQIAALIPSPPPSDTGTSTLPAGLWVYLLPWVDDLRAPPEARPLVASDALVDKMRVVIQQLQLPGATFEPTRYPNPSLQWHYRILQCMALEEEIPEDSAKDDKTTPRYRQINKRAGPYVIDWGEQLENEEINSPTTAKREADMTDRQPKRAKTETTSDENRSDDQLRQLVNKNQLQKLTLPELKPILTNRGLSTTGKKADLVDRLEQWLEKS